MSRPTQLGVSYTDQQLQDLQSYISRNQDDILKWKKSKTRLYKQGEVTTSDIVKYALEQLGAINVE